LYYNLHKLLNRLHNIIDNNYNNYHNYLYEVLQCYLDASGFCKKWLSRPLAVSDIVFNNTFYNNKNPYKSSTEVLKKIIVIISIHFYSNFNIETISYTELCIAIYSNSFSCLENYLYCSRLYHFSLAIHDRAHQYRIELLSLLFWEIITMCKQKQIFKRFSKELQLLW